MTEEKKKEIMIQKRSWKEFRESGFAWLINQTLHLFGWTIVFEINKNGDIVEIYPARTSFRGFSEEINTLGYERVTKYMKDNAEELAEEIEND